MQLGSVLFCLLFLLLPLNAQIDPLSSWNEGAAKEAILAFVKATTTTASPFYVAAVDRVVTFDQDGTLWVEHPLYTQGVFTLDRTKALSHQHPEWNQQEPFKTLLSGSSQAIGELGEEDWARILAATHSGMSTQSFLEIVANWLATATHPRFKKPYTELIYQPMRQLLDYFDAHGFKTYIVTGGGQEFVRVFSQFAYGIPTEQVVGSSIATRYEYDDTGKPILMREPKLFFNSNYKGKAIGINLFIGKKPYAAFGNSDGDREMLEWTESGPGKRLMMLVLHDDPEREYAYGPANGLPNTSVGTFSEDLMKEAKQRGWIIISMKQDWKQIFSFE